MQIFLVVEVTQTAAARALHPHPPFVTSLEIITNRFNSYGENEANRKKKGKSHFPQTEQLLTLTNHFIRVVDSAARWQRSAERFKNTSKVTFIFLIKNVELMNLQPRIASVDDSSLLNDYFFGNQYVNEIRDSCSIFTFWAMRAAICVWCR
jgi:hypothetical protein